MTNQEPTLMEMCARGVAGFYGPLIQALFILFIVLIFNFFVKKILILLRERFSRQRRIWQLSFVSALYKPLSYWIWFFAGLASLDLVLDGLFGIYILDIFSISAIAGVFALSWFLFRWNKLITRNLQDMSYEHRFGLTVAKVDVIRKLSTIFIIILTIVLLMDVTGRSMQTIIAFGGISGIALAFASQQVISNFFGGLMVYLTHPFTIGEWIHIPEKNIEGHVEEIGWYMTCIRNFDKRPIYVPNSIFTQSIVITPSRMSHNRIRERITIKYDHLDSIKNIVDDIRAMLIKNNRIDKQQKIEVYLKTFGHAGAEIEFSAFIDTNSDTNADAVRQEFLLSVKDIVAQHGAEFAVKLK
jgi:MscS family membrane protein